MKLEVDSKQNLMETE